MAPCPSQAKSARAQRLALFANEHRKACALCALSNGMDFDSGVTVLHLAEVFLQVTDASEPSL